uniref:Cell division cycle-associated protein 7 isoform X2 n=1 Tax=Petromyzon marinus TaxID=7757 RepID=A0AAJ7X688_PETMA|nr:cell division cycle-associated protein 7 isoform X2 [Petromyzon marinus]
MSAVVELASLVGCPSDEEFRGFRETELVAMETTSEDSSDSSTSSDHFSSGGVGQVRSPEETACMRELAKLFQDDSDTENDTFHGFTDSDVNLSNMIGTMSMESESDLGDSMEVPQLEKTALGETTPGRGRPFSLRVMLKFPAAGKRATGNSPTKNDNHKSSPPATAVIASSNLSATPRKRGRPRKSAVIAVPVFPVVVLTELAQDNPTRRSQRRTCKNELRPGPSIAQGDKNNNSSSVNDEVEEQVRDERDSARATEKVDPMDEGSDSEGEAELEQKMDFLTRRALNIKENKAMLARLMADLKTMPGLMGKFSIRSSTPSKARRPPKATTPGLSDGPVRRNPERSTRTNARSLGLRSSSPTSSPHLSLEERLRYKRKSSDSDDDGDDEYRPQRRRSGFYSTSAIQHVVRSVDEITQDELTLIATCTSEKSYNKVNGSTCHQCRQKTSDTKTCCRNPECWGVRGQFCGPCLRNRYGEDVRAALLDPAWHCPSCRGICNCSFCRRREGRCATGILIHLAKYHGYNNVQAYLESLQKEIDDED